MMHFVHTFSIMHAEGILLSKRFEIIMKLVASKTFVKMAGGRMHIPHHTPLNLPLAIRYTNDQKRLAYFSHLAPLFVFCFTKKQSQGGGVWHNGSF